ncbi:MAG: helix-turn-helix domain-containing protein [Campylobacterota bacterium]|nr:helix-turn-helix domain-containing protein [Campylobacterota bacterium]
MHTKDLILKEAMELFSELGYKGASVRKIAGKVGIRESALYNHFTNKEEIFHSVASTIFATPFGENENAESNQQKAKGGKKYLANFIVQYKLVTFDQKKERLFRILMIELLQNEQLRKSFMHEYHEKNTKMLSEAFFVMMQEGMIRSSDPMLLANEFLAPLFYLRLQVTLLRIDSQPTTALSTQFEKHVDFFWESIAL